MSRRKSQKRNTSQIILLALSLIVAGSMILSLFLAYLPGPRQPEGTPSPWPTWTPIPRPTATFTPTLPPQPSPTVGLTALPTATLLPTGETTPPPIGPVLPTATPTATPTTAAGFTFAVCGDSRDGPAVYRRLLEAVSNDGSLFLIHTGDLVNRGSQEQWRQFQEIMAGFALPFYPVPGNHDALDGRLDGYLRYSGAPASHYSFDYGPVHFTLADSHNGGLTSAELAWLRDDLKATAQPLKMVFLHHPPFDPDGSDHIMAFGNEPFMALMTEMGVDYVFAGHIHAYARAERGGVVYLYTGGAGAPLYKSGHPQAFHHYLRVTVQGEEVTIDIVKI